MRKMIGMLRKVFYYLEAGNGDSSTLPFSYQSTRASINKAQAWPHHFCLGHPSFLTLKTTFSLLLKELDLTSFRCEVC